MNKSLQTYKKLEKILAEKYGYQVQPEGKDFDLDRTIQSSLVEQRSQAWYDLRKNLVTGSKIATILKTNKYEKIYDFIGREILGTLHPTIFPQPQMFQQALDHGICYEEIIKMQFEHINDLNVIEAGLVQHQQITDSNKTNQSLPIAASPDGVITGLNRKRTSFNHMFYDEQQKKINFELLEIKCAFKRQILDSGLLFDIIPKYYYSQMQCQMECTNSNICHFYQAKISELKENQFIAKKKELDKLYDQGITTVDNILIESIATQETQSNQYQQDQKFIAISKPINTRTILGVSLKVYHEVNNVEMIKYFHPFSLNLDLEACQKWINKTLTILDDKYYVKHDSIKFWEITKLYTIKVTKDNRWKEQAKLIIDVYQQLKDNLLNDQKIQSKFIRKDKANIYRKYDDIHMIVDDLYKEESEYELLLQHEKEKEEEETSKITQYQIYQSEMQQELELTQSLYNDPKSVIRSLGKKINIKFYKQTNK